MLPLGELKSFQHSIKLICSLPENIKKIQIMIIVTIYRICNISVKDEIKNLDQLV